MIGIFGGTFDPLHYGHLRPLWEVKEALSLDEVRLIPCFIPPHRDTPGATPEQRLQMLQLAQEEAPDFTIDQRELQRGGPSYMVDTLQTLRDELGNKPICLIMGLDAFVGLDSWHQWQRINELAHIVVTQRPNALLPKTGAVAELLAVRQSLEIAELQSAPAGRIYFQSVTQLDISATAIRAEVAAKKDVRFLMPESVRKYIEANNLYLNH